MTAKSKEFLFGLVRKTRMEPTTSPDRRAVAASPCPPLPMMRGRPRPDRNAFEQLGADQIADTQQADAAQHGEWRRFKAKPLADGRERHHQGNREGNERRHRQHRFGQVLPWTAIGANDEDHQDLRCHRFQKPCRPEFRGCGLENKDEPTERQQIEQRRQRPHDRGEANEPAHCLLYTSPSPRDS